MDRIGPSKTSVAVGSAREGNGHRMSACSAVIYVVRLGLRKFFILGSVSCDRKF